MVLSESDSSNDQLSEHTELVELINTYSLQYGHLLFNNSNFWIKTCKMTIYQYPNQKVKKNKEDMKLEIFQLKDDWLMYRGMSICMADAVDEEKFLAYKFHKNNDEIVLEEYRIRIFDYFYKLVLFKNKLEYSQKIKQLALRDGCIFEESKIVRRNNHFLMIKGRYNQTKWEENQQLDYTKPEKTYIYSYKGRIEAFNEEFLRIVTYKRKKEVSESSDFKEKLPDFHLINNDLTEKGNIFDKSKPSPVLSDISHDLQIKLSKSSAISGRGVVKKSNKLDKTKQNQDMADIFLDGSSKKQDSKPAKPCQDIAEKGTTSKQTPQHQDIADDSHKVSSGKQSSKLTKQNQDIAEKNKFLIIGEQNQDIADKISNVSQKNEKSHFHFNKQNINSLDEKGKKKNNSEPKKQHKKVSSDELHSFHDGKRIHKIRMYNRKIAPIIDLDSLFVYKKHCLIQKVSFFDTDKRFHLAVTEDSIFLIFRDIIVCRPKKNVIGANLKKMRYFTADKNLEEEDLSDMFFILGLFFDWDIKMEKNHIFIRLFLTDSPKYIKLSQIENVLIQLLLMNYHKFVEPFLNDIFSFRFEDKNIEDKNSTNQNNKKTQTIPLEDTNSQNTLIEVSKQSKPTQNVSFNIHNGIETLYCNIYRRLDDNNRKYLCKFNIQIQDVKNLYKIILHSPDLLPRFIDLAINQKREYFITELISFYKKQNFKTHLEQIKRLLLINNHFYLFSLIEENDYIKDISDIVESDKKLIRAHYLRDVFSFKRQ